MMEQKRMILKEFMSPEARERCNFNIILVSRLALVKPEKAQKIEDMIIQNISMGTIKSKIDETMLIQYLEQLNEIEKPASSSIKVKTNIITIV
jgi:DNA-binding TFAR19-related protein (PDSD5 family)